MIRASFFRACLVVTALFVTVHAQAPPRDVPSVPPPTGTAGLAGVVKDLDGSPVRRATVKIAGDMRLDRLTVADDEGKFAFDGLPAGRFTITALKAGYPERSYGARQPYRAGSGVLLKDGQQMRDLVVTLAKGAVITGTVFDQRGEPAQGVPIMAWQIRTSLAGERTLDIVGSEPDTIITDDMGRYRVYGLPPGEYTIGTSWYFDGGESLRVPTDAEIRAAFQSAQAARSGQPAPPQPSDEKRDSLAPSFIPGVVDPMSASTVTVAAGEIRDGVDLRMQFLPMSEIVATVATADGSPFEVELTVAKRSAVEALNTMLVRPGMTEKDYRSGSLSPGAYTIQAQSDATLTKPSMWARADVIAAPGQTATAALILQPAIILTGKVVFEGATLPAPKDPKQIQIGVRPVGGATTQTESNVDAAGYLKTTGIIPGQYRVTGTISGGPPAGTWWSVKSVTVDGRDLTDLPIEVSTGNVPNLTITFTDVTAEVSGTLTMPSGAPATDYFLVILPADRTYWSSRSRRVASTRPDVTGKYSFARLPPGEYILAVTTDLIPEDLRDPNALERLATQGAKVSLAFGEKKTLDLKTTR